MFGLFLANAGNPDIGLKFRQRPFKGFQFHLLGKVLVALILAILVRCYGTLSFAPESDRPLLLVGAIAAISLLIASGTYDAFSFDQFLPTCLLLMGVGLARADLLRRAGSPRSPTTQSS